MAVRHLSPVPINNPGEPMSFDVIPAETITDNTITTILDQASIEHSEHAGIYVTGYDFNFWVAAEPERNLLILWSYWNVLPEAEEIEILSFVNSLNRTKIMLQFSYSGEMDRFYGYYSQPYHAGLIPQNLLKVCQKFSAVLSESINDGIEKGVLQPLPDCGRSQPDADHETKH
jgi:hypothetical protein